ncbi:MAG: ATP-binding protein [Gemmatimonadetes bacterium]|nr:ATP-binding protein [Gemmatimonadota bacterium]
MKLLPRTAHVAALRRHLGRAPVVALLGARQVGKTTLAGLVAKAHRGPVTRFDLEDPRDVARLADPMLALAGLRGLVILDEIQRRPDLFPALRVLADRRPIRARFLVLGSASPDLLHQGAETLAGRVAFHELPPLSVAETGPDQLVRLWRRGGFPPAFAARTEDASAEWRRAFIRTFLERDVPQLGIRIAAATLGRFWAMIAHVHGQLLNSSELGRALGVSDTAVRHYVDLLEATFVVRTLRPYHANIGKRQVKAPKVYIADSGLLHSLLDVTRQYDLDRHPKVGASWEGFLIETVIAQLGYRRDQCYFWGTYAGAELDLLVVDGRRRVGFEFKRTTAPRVSPSMRAALADLKLHQLNVIHAGEDTFALAPRIRAIAATRLTADL